MPDTPITSAEALADGSPQAAVRALSQMTEVHRRASMPQPTTDSGRARAQLAALSNDPKWRSDFLRGNPQARQEFVTLTADLGDCAAERLKTETIPRRQSPGRVIRVEVSLWIKVRPAAELGLVCLVLEF
jgi:hypothetical protein